MPLDFDGFKIVVDNTKKARHPPYAYAERDIFNLAHAYIHVPTFLVAGSKAAFSQCQFEAPVSPGSMIWSEP